MNTYKITFTRENGTVGSDNFTAPSEAQARRDFKEVYRHGNGTITSVELVSSDAPPPSGRNGPPSRKSAKSLMSSARTATSPPPLTDASRMQRPTSKTTGP